MELKSAMDLPIQRRKFEESEEMEWAVRCMVMCQIGSYWELLDFNVDLERVQLSGRRAKRLVSDTGN